MKEVILRFDSDLSSEIFVSINKKQLEDQETGVPTCLVKDYRLEFLCADQIVYQIRETDNYLRHRIHKLQDYIVCDRIKLLIQNTNGQPEAGVFEIRVY